MSCVSGTAPATRTGFMSPPGRRVARREDAVGLDEPCQEPAIRVVAACAHAEPREERVLHAGLDLDARRHGQPRDLAPLAPGRDDVRPAGAARLSPAVDETLLE